MTSTTHHWCYHCGTRHPEEEMRQVPSKAGMRWRCIRSIEAAKSPQGTRDAFGRQMTEANRKDAEKMARRILGDK